MAHFWMLASIFLGLSRSAYGCGATGAGVGAGVGAAAGGAGRAVGLAVNPAGHISHGIAGAAQIPIPIGKCIYEEAEVRMADGTLKKVKHLNAGDQALAYDAQVGVHASRVLGEFHSDNETLITIVEIETSSGRKIPVTMEHSLFVRPCLSGDEWSPKSAQDVSVGECVPRYDARDGDVIEESVTDIRLFSARGIRQPVTETGTIIVDDVVISCYDRVVSQRATHMALLPYRFFLGLAKTYGANFKSLLPAVWNAIGFDASLF
jgi:hypothetical protein